MFGTVLVANRGEIACRVIATLRRLGIRSAAVYSDADAGAKHVALADVAVRIGPAPASESYLSIAAILDAATQVGADAIHPGYGFLSENSEFARACAARGIVFIGPPPSAIEAMGDKIAAKALVAGRGVPVVPGSSGAGLDDAALTAAATEVGYPLLIKPSAGGGGKGMQVVATPGELPAALVSARRIATASFGDDTLLLERLIAAPRHIEVQVLADRHGAVVHLGERECSLQRRHQKVIEEAPSPLLDDATRARIGEAACEVARSVAYEGAGTVEFLISDADPGTFFFIEMNTRLQVEHPVTEAVTGLDLVEQQLRIAAGEPLAFAQADVVVTGHAIEARVYAESPARGFLPATGTVLGLVEPTGPGQRVDSSLVPGLVVSGDYDPMLAKAIGYGADRTEALARLDGLLRGFAVLGVETNIDYLRGLLADPAVQAGRLDTGLIDRLGVPAPPEPTEADLAAAALAVHRDRPALPGPWGLRDGWRVGGVSRPARYGIEVGADIREVAVDPAPASTALVAVQRVRGGHVVWLHRDGRTLELPVPDRAERLARTLAALDRSTGPAAPELRAAMPGTVVSVTGEDGARVDAGDPVLSIEAMKMEHALLAPHSGTLRLRVRTGDLVRRDQIVAIVDLDVDLATEHPETDQQEKSA
ncbi:acetyl/propionyl-CoA carboxylase subuit alpha [Pseudolysinimonas yzui]|uniref:biotin carboxylase n=2 Tax=Pseudolysinimonas yzui TaxID=2708254 RepID=A0A8J3M2Y7_9MICO|nr:acetyl/propionyl-CoA carboxylase subuit alpha [Pseudolysinimonas yzui]